MTLLSYEPPLQSQLVRQALAYSLDRPLISERVSHHQRRPLRSLIPPSLRGGKPEPWPHFNPSKARSLFKQAGYCHGKTLHLPFTYRSNVPSDRLMALFWQAQLRRDLDDCVQLGLEGVESTAVYRQLGEGAFKAVMLDWGGSIPIEAYLAPLLAAHKIEVCEAGEAVISGSFWTKPGLEAALRRSDAIKGNLGCSNCSGLMPWPPKAPPTCRCGW